jgi:L-fucose isomerase-like protein
VAVVEAAMAGTPAHSQGEPVTPDVAAGQALAAGLSDTTVGRVGLPPTGFDPCEAEPDLIDALGVSFDEQPLDVLFERAAVATATPVRGLTGVEDLDPMGVDRSARLHAGLRSLAEEGGWDALATRCWPECFTEFGAAACSPQSWLAEAGIPAACEADIPGTLSALVLDRAAGRRAFVADLVDVAADGTMALWHCGNAPVSMAGEEPRATVHPNRGLPLLNEFRIAPGRITVARFTRSKGETRLVIGGGEVVDEPRPYWGTSGVVRMDRPGDEVLDTVMGEGLDHHFALVHGDVRAEMAGLAGALGIGTVWL